MYRLTKTALIALMALLSVKAVLTDRRDEIISNRDIVLFGIPMTVLSFIYSFCFFEEYLTRQIANIFFLSVVSFLLQRLRMWGGGDAKLAIVLGAGMPVDIYCEFFSFYFSMFIPVIITFSIGFLYLIIGSIIDGFRMRKTLVYQMDWKQAIVSGVISFLNAGAVSTVFRGAVELMDERIMLDPSSMMVLEIMTVFFISSSGMIPRNRWSAIVSLAVIGTGALLDIERFVPVIGESFLIMVAVMFLEWFVSRYDYSEIPVSELKEGMVLASSSVFLWIDHRDKDLPRVTTEDLRSKLDAAACEAIRRWAGDREATVWIVRKIRFALFVVLGFATVIIVGTVL